MVTLLPEIWDSEFDDDKERVNANEMGIVLEARRNSTGNRKKAIIRGDYSNPPIWLLLWSVSWELVQAVSYHS